MLKQKDTVKKRTALGQGLDALIPIDLSFAPQEQNGQSIKSVPINLLKPNPYQPRRLFNDESLSDLAQSITEIGFIQPLIVRDSSDGTYEIVAGERRWRAANIAGLESVPVIVRPLTDLESLEIAIIENIQREDLNPVDTAEAYETLINKFSYTHEALAKRICKDRTSITNQLRLLKLPDPIKEDLREQKLSMGHARTLLAIDNISTQLSLSSRVVKRKLSVRELERIVQNYRNKKDKTAKDKPEDYYENSRIEKDLSSLLSTKVKLIKKPNNSGRLEIYFHSIDELSRLLDTIGLQEELS
jgi:ParB family chromosome partitioning protein